jgi:hypothetical protein
MHEFMQNLARKIKKKSLKRLRIYGREIAKITSENIV